MNIFEAFELMNKGHIVKDDDGNWFKKDEGTLIDSVDGGKTWFPTEEFKYGFINQKWHLVQ